MFWSPAQRTVNRGRASGGLLVGVKRNDLISSKIQIIDEEVVASIYDRRNRLVVRVVPIYLNFSFWQREYAKFENFLEKNHGLLGSCLFVGDFNGRVGSQQVLDEDILSLNTGLSTARCSEDSHVNTKGNKLLELFENFGLVILNGRTLGDEDGKITFIGNNGKSVVDFALVTNDFLESILKFKVLTQTYSDHLPIVTDFRIPFSSNEFQNYKLLPKLFWKAPKQNEYNNYVENSLRNLLHNNNIITMASITEIIYNAEKSWASPNNNCLFKTPWFDLECKKFRIKVFQLLKDYRKNNYCDIIKKRFDEVNGEYIAICKQKRETFYKNAASGLSGIKSTKDWWRWAKVINNKNKKDNCLVSSSELKVYFSNLLNRTSVSTDFYFVENFRSDIILDSDFTMSDLLSSLKSMDDQKAPGSDRIPIEFLKYGPDILHSTLLTLFNKIFNNEASFDNNSSIIIPLHKKGDKSIVSNYRGISLKNSFDKLYSKMLYDKLLKFVTTNKTLSEFQAGFRPGYSTNDNIFNLCNIVKIKWKQGIKKVFCFFVDFRAAFDCVPRSSLFYKLYKAGVSTKFLNALRKLYKNTTNAIWNGNELSEWFETLTGVKQGCILSPILFSLYINDLCKFIGGGVMIGDCSINALLYADDIVLIAEDKAVLQKMIDKLHEYCLIWGLEINLTKSQIMIMRKGGGRNAGVDKWFLNGSEIEIVKTYKYLGVEIKFNLNFNEYFKNRATKSKFMINSTWNNFIDNQWVDFRSKCELFNSVARSTLCCNAQNFGYKQVNLLEEVQRYFVKRSLGLPRSTPNYHLIVECGLREIYEFTLKLHMFYITNILFKLGDDRLPKHIAKYCILYKIDWYEQWIDFGNQHGLHWDFENEEQWKVNVGVVLKQVHNKSFSDALSRARGTTTHGCFNKLSYMNGNGIFNCGLETNILRTILLCRGGMISINDVPWRSGTEKICSLCNLRQNENVQHFMGICPVLKHIRQRHFNEEFLEEDKIIEYLNGPNWIKLYNYVKQAYSFRQTLINVFNH